MVKLTVDSAKAMLLELLATATLSALPLVILGGIGEFLFGLPVVTFRHFVSLAVFVGVSDALTNQLFNWAISPVLIFVLIFGLAGGGIELYFDLTSMNASTVFDLILGLGVLVAVAGILQDNPDSGDYEQTVANDSNESMGDDRTISVNFDPGSDSESDPFTEKVDPLAVRSKAVEIAGDHPPGGDGDVSYSQLAAIHQYINENISYVPDPSKKNYVAPPDETLRTGAGDCDCQAVLVASMFEAIGATTRLVLCESVTGDRHLLAEVYLASDSSELQNIHSSLSTYYATQGLGYDSVYYEYESETSRYWYPADTAMGRYIGDIHQLSSNGYINGPASDGSWSWHNVDYYDS